MQYQRKFEAELSKRIGADRTHARACATATVGPSADAEACAEAEAEAEAFAEAEAEAFATVRRLGGERLRLVAVGGAVVPEVC